MTGVQTCALPIWPLIFTVNIPIGIVATFLSVLFVDKKPGEGEQKKGFVIDYTGIALLAVGIGSLQYVLERGESEDWFASEAIRILSVTALVGVVGPLQLDVLKARLDAEYSLPVDFEISEFQLARWMPTVKSMYFLDLDESEQITE